MQITTDTPVLRKLAIMDKNDDQVLQIEISRTTSGVEPAYIMVEDQCYDKIGLKQDELEAVYAAWKAFEADKRPRTVVATLYYFDPTAATTMWRRHCFTLTRTVWMGNNYGAYAHMCQYGYHCIYGPVTDDFQSFYDVYGASTKEVYDDENVVVMQDDDGFPYLEVQKRG